jgi:hypothetical protein
MSTPLRARCSVCGRSVVLRGTDGKLRRHGFSLNGRDGHCAGSGTPPEAIPAEHQPRQHPRRTQ